MNRFEDLPDGVVATKERGRQHPRQGVAHDNARVTPPASSAASESVRRARRRGCRRR
jgi:hypothetical protein